MKWRVMLGVFLVLMIGLSGVGSATIGNSTTQIKIYNPSSYDIQDVYDYFVGVHGEAETQQALLNETSPGVWEIYKYLFLYSDSNLNINSSSAIEIRFCARNENAPQYAMWTRWNSTVHAKDVAITSYNKTSESYREYDEDYIVALSSAENVTFHHLERVYIGDASGDDTTTSGDVIGCEFYNISFGLEFWNTDITNVSNNYFHDNNQSTGCGIDSSDIDNGIFLNNRMQNVSERSQETSSTYGFQIVGENNYINNLTVNNVAYSGINIIGNNNSFSDIIVNDSAHNSIEFQCTNSTLTNFYINGCNDNGLFSSVDDADGFPAVGYNTIQNGTIIEDGTGYCINFGTSTHDIQVKNVSLSGDGIILMNVYDSIFTDIQQIIPGLRGINMYYLSTQWGRSENNTFIDSSFVDNSIYDYQNQNCTNAKLANVNFSSTELVVGNYTVLYPLNMIVKDGSANPLNAATITVTTDSFTLDGLGHEQYVFTTGADGKPTEQINLANLTRDSVAGYGYHFSNVTVSKAGYISDSEYNIVPDETYYSPDVSDLQGPLFTFVLPLSAPLVIDSFTPTDTTPTSVNETPQLFTVDLNIQGNVTWLIDSEEVQTNTSVTTASYTNSTAPAGTYNVTAIATDGVTNVSQIWTWTVTETPVTPTDESTDWATMQNNTASTFTSIFGTVVGMYIISGIVLVYGYNNDKYGITNTTLKYYMLAGFSIAMLIIIGLGIMQIFDSTMTGLI